MNIKKLKNTEVRIEPTNLCNYHCIMCPREKHSRKQGIMNMELYNSIIEQVVSLGAEKITLVNYGEPFIDPTLEEKILIATRNGLTTYLITNASLFSKKSNYDKDKSKLQVAIENGLTELRLSFYGKDKYNYENTMVGGKFEEVIKNIELLYELKQKYNSLEVSHFMLGSSESDISYKDYPEILKKVVDYYEMWKPHNFGDGRNYRELGKVEKKSCGRPENGPLQINWSGIVVPCCYDYNENIILGDASITPIIEILNSVEYNDLREAHKKNDYSKFKYCDNCDQLLCNKKDVSIIKTTNPKHAGMDNSEIVKRTNTSPEKNIC